MGTLGRRGRRSRQQLQQDLTRPRQQLRRQKRNFSGYQIGQEPVPEQVFKINCRALSVA
ncbi:hypothetical protein NC652_007372 [Populus alba x Populus x berolinensis]|uniref:Uncharacterized protein n=1 Tax=Populus alba x Populus x berolinensis TaxID=444605 RepID=A0AAD6WDC8_9ROSI|nr:hypothetical protein NC652_007372 [Populus alba x Populus x berolinensis]KAJ7008600.1 hypothetical protein NC653_007308 [Populus alba x Populus x berolinensis]